MPQQHCGIRDSTLQALIGRIMQPSMQQWCICSEIISPSNRITAKYKMPSMAIARRKLLPSRWKEYLGEMQDVRNNADYKNKGVSKNRAQEQLRRAQEFISTLIPEIQL